jgi:hypothetical protein
VLRCVWPLHNQRFGETVHDNIATAPQNSHIPNCLIALANAISTQKARES